MLLSDRYPFLTNYFTQALSSNDRPLPQSILFYGNDLEAQYTLSKEIARLLNCKKIKQMIAIVLIANGLEKTLILL